MREQFCERVQHLWELHHPMKYMCSCHCFQIAMNRSLKTIIETYHERSPSEESASSQAGYCGAVPQTRGKKLLYFVNFKICVHFITEMLRDTHTGFLTLDLTLR